MSEPLQLFPSLPPAIEDALRASIRRFGVLVPVVKDQHGRTLDGHHRSRIASEEGVKFRVDVITVASDDEAREIAHTLNSDRRQMTPDQRQEVAVALRQAGHSYRAIAGALGVSEATVHRDVSTVTDVTVPDRVVGLDGKSRPARRPPTVAAKNEREADRALAAIEAAGGQLPLGGDVIDIKQAERAARKAAADRAREADLPAQLSEASVIVRLGDFREVLADIADGSVDVILTDPPYPGEYLPLWSDLAVFASRVLKPDGVLLAMSGQTHLPEVYRRLSEHLIYRWTMAYLTPGSSYQSQARNLASQWKPVLVYGATDRRLFDVARSDADDKKHHHWGQSESGIDALLRQVARPGDLICDPFVGGGTTPFVAREYGCSFIGAELDKVAYGATLERLSA